MSGALQPPTQDELSDFEHAEAVRRLNERGFVHLTCEVCNKSNYWVLSKVVFSPIAMGRPDIVSGKAGMFFGGNTMPSAPLLCTNCGNTKLINLIVLGIRGGPHG